MPIGLSFITFQKIAFLADAYSGEIKSVTPLHFLLFTLYFPRTVAGPIVHYNEIVPQFSSEKSRYGAADLAVGICMFAIGLFKKAVIADSLSGYVTPIFDGPPYNPLLSLTTAWSATLSYAFQIYFDFSGYSDMALGVARMFGVRLPMNFDSPFKATSIIEFWSRWHITLTRFLTAYVYTPLALHLSRVCQKSRGASVRRHSAPAIVIMIATPTIVTMAISGIWHGAGWHFLAWGVLHGVYLTINQCWRALRPQSWSVSVAHKKMMKSVSFLITFGAVLIAFLFFRCASANSALTILGAMVGLNGIQPHYLPLLEDFGVPLHTLRILADFYGYGVIAPFTGVLLLLIVVLFLPNSLELMRRFESELDFQKETPRSSERSETNGVGQPRPRGAAGWYPADVKGVFKIVKQDWRDGRTFGPAMVLLTAILLVFGLMALDRGSVFVYAQF
jgi:D-alanyl-lipoteichoic acid acyltransferase DltB (MBOAT superfamily)